MWLLRGLAASLLWILAGLVGLVGVVLSVTLILLPIGIPLIMLARKIFAYSMVVLVPRKVRHPVAEVGDSARGGVKRLLGRSRSRGGSPWKKAKKALG
jgi:uncharacterized protein (DUF697 family)